MKINEKIIVDFAKLQENLFPIIEAYGLKKNYVAEKAGIDRGTFYRKQKTKTFTAMELLKIAKIINK